jgi:heptosyltransferase II
MIGARREASAERRSHSPWRGPVPPGRALLIRFHALGDVALVLPAAAHIARRWPGSRIDMLTCSPADSLALATGIFHTVHVLPARQARLARILFALRMGLSLRRLRYDIVIDLQRNYLSRMIRLISGVRAWSEFDRFSPLPASVRIISTLSASGIEHPMHEIPLPFSDDFAKRGRKILHESGWDGSTRLVVFNPAGLWETRNWPISNYVELYRLWSMREPVRILALGTDRVKKKMESISRETDGGVINLAGRTTPGEAFAILPHASVIVTEDSGLMHMAWAAGVPVVALFGSSRTVWSAPQGERAVCLDSSDLQCGCCMESRCRFGDVHCLTRRLPAEVLDSALLLLDRVHASSQTHRQ